MNDMSQTIVNLGYVPKNRGEYSSTASYYKDNIVQYNGSSYICNPPNYDPDTAPTASITGVAPYASDPAVPNTGWAVFCNDSSGVGEGVYDVSVDHTTDNQPKIYASLSAARNDIPAAKKKGGMEIRFIFNNSNYAVDKEEGITTQPAGTLITSNPTMVDGTYKASQLLTYFSTLPTATGAGNAVVYYKEVDGTYTTWTITLQSSDNKYVQYRYKGTDITGNPDPFLNVYNWQMDNEESFMFDVPYSSKKKAYVDNTNVETNNDKFLLYYFDDIDRFLNVKILFASGGAYALFVDGNDQIVGEPFQSIYAHGIGRYRSMWSIVNVPTGAKRLKVSIVNNPASYADVIFPLRVIAHTNSDEFKDMIDNEEVRANNVEQSLRTDVDIVITDVEELNKKCQIPVDTYHHGSSTYNGAAVTKGKVWASSHKISISGEIKSIYLPTENVTDEPIAIGIAKAIEGTDNIGIVRAYEVELSTGNNNLASSIRVEKDDYICILNYEDGSGAIHSVIGTSGGFHSTESPYPNKIEVGQVLVPFSGVIDDLGIQFNIEKVEYPNVSIPEIKEKTDILNSFKGKKLLTIGDSLTDNGLWVNPLTDMLGTVTFNRGLSGTYMTVVSGRQNSFCERFDLPASDADTHSAGFPTETDLILLLGGINDWGGNVTFGDPTAAVDNTTFCGACHYLFGGLKERYPNAKIVIINNYRVWPPKRFTSHREIQYTVDGNENGGFTYVKKSNKTLQEWRDTYCNIASMYGLPIIDLEKVGFSFWREEDREMYSLYQSDGEGGMIYDGLHPSAAGGLKMAEYFAKCLLSL